MEFARPLMWNVPPLSELLLYLMIPVVLVVLVGGILWRVQKWFLGQPEPNNGAFLAHLRQRLRWKPLLEWIAKAMFQSRLRNDRFALAMHLTIFWGMVILFFGTVVATIDQDIAHLIFGSQILRGGLYNWFELVLDLFGVVLLVGLALAGYRRLIQRPVRLQPPSRPVSLWDSFPFLRLLALIALTGFLVEGLRLAQGLRLDQELSEIPSRSTQPPETRNSHASLSSTSLPSETSPPVSSAESFARWEEKWRMLGARHLDANRQEAELHRILHQGQVFPAGSWAPVGYALAQLFQKASLESLQTWHRLFWWLHGLLAFGFLVALPFTKAFHLIASPVHMVVKSSRPVGQLPVVVPSGAATLRDFTWEQLLQVDSCTWCGRCEEVCPAAQGGFPLSPKNLVHAIDGLLLRTSARKTSHGPTNSPPDNPQTLPGFLHGKAVSAEELWSCYTCRACAEICPVEIEHPRTIIDMRRYLVDQGQVDENLQEALMHLQRYGNSFGQSPRKRLETLQKAGIPIRDARKEEVEYLWFLGDYAAYDPRVAEATLAAARILVRCGVSFGFLMEKEQNAGNDVRRVGEEGLFEMLREKNLQTLAAARFQTLFTTDPHSYNTLKNEYVSLTPLLTANNGTHRPSSSDHPENSPLAGKPIYHYTELFDRWLTEGKLTIRRPLQITVTYHDPCYLGRFNGVYDPPRRILKALGVRLIEMPRHQENSFCCGAGGGKIWMKDLPGAQIRPAESRIHEALALPGVQMLVVACPKDMVMFQDAVKTAGAENRLQIVDLAQLLDQATAPQDQQIP